MPDEKRHIVVTDVKIPFLSMVMLVVDWALTSISAIFILFVVWALATIAVAAISGGNMHHLEINSWWGGRV